MYHISYSIAEVSKLIDARSFTPISNAALHTLAFDSRKLGDIHHALFFALQGRRNGHEFIAEAYDAGVRNFVVSDERFFPGKYTDANFLLVADTLQALQMLTAHHRSLFDIPVIGITGSNGKTIVKEWLYQLLAPEKNVVRSPKSYNSQIGVPLSVWAMSEEHTMAIFEAGVSRSGEMSSLEEIIKPTIGILTNIGQAHNEGFGSLEEKIAEKLKLFKDTDLFIYSPKYLQGYTGDIPGKQQFTWCWNGKADLEIIDGEISEDNKFQFLRGKYLGLDVQCLIPFTDAASVENAICCWATMLALGYSPLIADQRIEKLQPVRMRLELKTGINNCSVIDDSYSLDISSLAIALDFLKQQKQHQQRTLILSDIPEAGTDSETLYTQVAALLENKKVDRLIGIGSEIGKHAGKFGISHAFFPDTATFLENLDELGLANESILLKGARRFEFERISKALTQKVHETVLEINLNALENNLNYYKSQLKPGVKITTMVKAFSYGSGSFEIANLLQFNKVDYLAVAFADEGVSLRSSGITLPIMVMNPDVMGFDTMIDNNLEPEIYSLRVLKDFIAVLNRKNREDYPVHIKLDTGMHRLGFVGTELEALLPELKATKVVRVKSAFSHLTSSEDPASDDFTRQQIALFKEWTSLIESAVGYPVIKHLANTSAISRWPEAQFDMVRLGIGLYGIDSVYQGKASPLETVATLKTSISQIKTLKAGETVGYNRRGVLRQDGKVATVKIGYADGYNRKLGNGTGKMMVRGKVVPTIGSICMDMCMLDITGVDAREGDEVIVFNRDISVEWIAEQLGTIPYEILTGISQRVKRVYYYE
ncbi:UDP-N-acetylmuramoyl-tripeptide--D-alanyl-D-alanine ligase [Arcticibacter tournemirensis]|uniref:Alanine racemase n=1 Tax=Arcticibacter tournemirensis TaxID=699437 RepID=A0A5M9H1P5_9SPHI|nr:bifunctional UDP-N-acetylmuramoyl-tripeptide:D-alanyl-D-alanine ligase/alanine racemase [Arcticibacter tournemirensis]KAA8479921.1 bifunctional UDP-N-acetylmuramoyl-tripeptide:D-alanyl-D-alanine ligase/alanine racemase [Arcticibacter tournemirensis]TQM51621.1 UDP-N-acetylmuramoyl-tripeptide--D-alanyl-D-alanine ligase [Arcticibacter tournemirensis]